MAWRNKIEVRHIMTRYIILGVPFFILIALFKFISNSYSFWIILAVYNIIILFYAFYFHSRVMSFLAVKYLPCPFCKKSVGVYEDWKCDYCHKYQGGKRPITAKCMHCKRFLKVVYCEHCHREIKL